MARLEARWKAAQLPLRLREKILFWFVQSFFSRLTSLKSTNVGRGHPSGVQKRQRFLRLRPRRLRGIRRSSPEWFHERFVFNQSSDQECDILFQRSACVKHYFIQLFRNPENFRLNSVWIHDRLDDLLMGHTAKTAPFGVPGNRDHPAFDRRCLLHPGFVSGDTASISRETRQSNPS